MPEYKMLFKAVNPYPANGDKCHVFHMKSIICLLVSCRESRWSTVFARICLDTLSLK